MKAKSIAVIAIVFVGVMCLLSSPASAEQAWYTCAVETAGPGGSSTYIRLTDSAATPAFTNRWFEAPSSRAKEMLVVALTAISNSLTVKVLTDPAETGMPDIACFYLMAE